MRATVGQSAAVIVILTGQTALGLPPESDLAVDSSADLAVDVSDDLEIGPGNTWAGASAARTIET